MKIGARVSRTGGEAAPSRVKGLKERLLRERERALEDAMQQRRRADAPIEATRTGPRTRGRS